jgi:spore maturation protein CgeB
MRILILATDYPRFLTRLYGQNPGLETASYAEQARLREASLFGAAAFYALNFIRHGHVAQVVYPNNFLMQSAWAREHGMAVPQKEQKAHEESHAVAWLKARLRPYKSLLGSLALRFSPIGPLQGFERDVLLAQIEDFAPDVILNQDLQAIDGKFIRQVRKRGRLMAAQIGVDPPPGLDTGAYDLGISHIPWVVDFFNRRGLRAERQHLCFETSVLEKLGPAPEPDIDVSFVGGLSSAHATRVAFLDAVARRFRLSLWVPSLKGIPASSPLHACRQGEVYGAEMFDVLRRSRITLNSHINVARGSAGNMRLFEATGMGTLLLTDDLADLPELFAPGREVAAYGSVDDCLSRIEHFLKNETERRAVAAAGQARTLSDHSYYARAADMLNFMERCAR